MIKVIDLRDCCGCSACVQICPKKCIAFNEDSYGFRYPIVDSGICIDCGLCEKVCPVLNQSESCKPMKVYAAQNQQERVRLNSSSGGVFTLMAEHVVNQGGVVFGAAFDEKWEVEHRYAMTRDGLDQFRGSKYLQSRIGNTYLQARDFLDKGRMVLYSGTSCQISGLKRFLKKDYENLLTIDVVCHGVPSPMVWRSYLKEVISIDKVSDIKTISFRSKSTGWRKYSLVITGMNKDVSEVSSKNIFMQLFLNNLCLRPSCFQCPSKSGRSGSDVTLADYWGIEDNYPEWDDDKGTSLILVNTSRGVSIVDRLVSHKVETSYEDAVRRNSCIEVSTRYNSLSEEFWTSYKQKGLSDACLVLRKLRPSVFIRILNRVRLLLK